MTDWTYPRYALSERIADGVIHAIGLAFAIAGTVVLILLAESIPKGAAAVYGGTLIAGFLASALYHMTPWEGARPVLRRIDHAAIYLKIAGTYTPLVAAMGGLFAWIVLAAVWVLAAAGAVTKIAFWRTPGRWGAVAYLALGWGALLLAVPLVQTLPIGVAVLVGAGGVIYSAGVVFFHWESLRFANAIWHGFVLTASGCFFAAITWAAVA